MRSFQKRGPRVAPIWESILKQLLLVKLYNILEHMN